MAHTFWPADWGAFLSPNIYRPVDMPSQMALSEPGNAQGAPHTECGEDRQSHEAQEPSQEEGWEGAELPASNRAEGSESSRQGAERLPFIPARLPSGKGAFPASVEKAP